MMGAVWNFTKSLADTTPRDAHREAMLARIERNAQDNERAKTERAQLSWRPSPGRVPYAGREQ
jgi:hypothetical protein